MICGWLGLADKRWPPDPYALLGLTPENCAGPRIEQQVQERVAKLRLYQLSPPAEATEAMHRVAQAYIQLLDQHCSPAQAVAAPPKPAVPVEAPKPPAEPPAVPAPRPSGETAVAQQT